MEQARNAVIDIHIFAEKLRWIIVLKRFEWGSKLFKIASCQEPIPYIY